MSEIDIKKLLMESLYMELEMAVEADPNGQLTQEALESIINKFFTWKRNLLRT